MTQIGIVDPCCASGYAPASLDAGGLGGTEATVLRVAGALAPNGDVLHFQNGRNLREWTDAGWMAPLAEAFTSSAPGTLIVINSWKVALKLRRVHPEADIALWLHVYPGRHNRGMGDALARAGVTVICVSQSHAQRMRAFLSGRPMPPIRVAYNPIVDDLCPNDTPRNRDRLLFASSPHKGLRQVFRQFAAARSEIPSLILAVADPGYLAWDVGPVPDGVTFLGALPHSALIRALRRSLCLFYPQTSFAETFGLVLAEANAVGTPVLAHRGLGANSEVLGDPRQLIDGEDLGQIVGRLREWRAAPPAVEINPDFRLSAVARWWIDFLAPDRTTARVMERVT